MRNNEEIIRIAAEMQSQIRDGLVQLIQNGAPIGVMHPLIETLDRLERVPSELTEPHHGGHILSQIECGGAVAYGPASDWRHRALQAEEELLRRRPLVEVGQIPESMAIAEGIGH